MTAPDPRLDEIEARLSAATPGPWKADTATRGDCVVWGPDGRFLMNAQAEPHWVEYPGEKRAVSFDVDKRDCEFIAHAPADVAYLLAELRKARAALARVEGLHRPAKIYDECECPAGTHPDGYDYIECDSYAGCENSLIGIGCEECCVHGDGLSERCGESHTHTLDPDTRCQTVSATRATIAAANGGGDHSEEPDEEVAHAMWCRGDHEGPCSRGRLTGTEKR